MAFNDLREFLKKLEETGDVVNISLKIKGKRSAVSYQRSAFP